MAVIGDREGIRSFGQYSMRPGASRWLPVAERAEADASLVDAIVVAVIAQPGLKQSELKLRVSGDGRRLGALAAWWTRASDCSGSTIIDLSPVSTRFPTQAARNRSGSPAEGNRLNHLDDCACALACPISLRPSRPPPKSGNLPYMRLPKAPIAWQEPNESEPIMDEAHDTKRERRRGTTLRASPSPGMVGR